MGFREKRADKRALKAYEPEIAAQYEQELGLVISPDDVMSFLERDSYNYPQRKILYESLGRKLQGTYRRTSDRHGQHILALSQRAAFAYEQPDEVQTFTRGYHLYLGVLAFKKCLRQRLDLPDAVLESMAPETITRQSVTKLADHGYQVTPFFVDIAPLIVTASQLPSQRLVALALSHEAIPRCDGALLAAGIGLGAVHAAYVLRQRADITEDYKASTERDL